MQWDAGHPDRGVASGGNPPAGEGVSSELREALGDLHRRLQLKFRHVRTAFRQADANCDGVITRTELKEFLVGFGLGYISDQLFGLMDKNGKGEVDFAQFTMLFDNAFCNGMEPYLKHKAAIAEGQHCDKEVDSIIKVLGEKLYVRHINAHQAFLSLDRNENGDVTREGLDRFFRKMCVPTEASSKVFKALGAQGSGVVDRDRFVALFGPAVA